MKQKVVLAFSGGLDTSFCVPYLMNEKGLEVHTVIVNTGGFSDEEAAKIEERALKLGAASHTCIDAVNDYYNNGIKYLIFGNVLKNNTYPLSVSSERFFQAMAILEHVRKTGADYVAHGSTGAGNDQVRFDLVFEVLAPEVKIIAPIRELSLSRQQEIDYLKEKGFDFSWEKSKYSINQGIWGTSVGGVETLKSSGVLPEEAYPSQVVNHGTERITIGFEKGEPVKLNGEKMDPVELIHKLHKTASQYGIGRDVHVGDTIIGTKGRVAFEAPAPLIIVKAHHLLEKHVLTKQQLYWKDQLSNWYGQLMHEAQYLEPVMRNIETFLNDTQKYVTGEVEVELRPYHFSVLGCSSEFDLMSSKFGEYGESNKSFTGQDVVGFTKVTANPLKIYYTIHDND
ncbi:MAG TPA: argininosuccinate synthase [Fermentimonas caenicola]|jgi:argininosuccinate synthase|uniref:argininosuccinate synthase n=1 Tax=Fermentimonas caenicola TaxID=1562970 RepID=A0A098BXM9_9BACT|nr:MULTISPECIES: argininosuccinate synthase [Lascolabacillus]MBP6175257.1 argininosuccinate synthase [Fermentimonas sp.]MDI9625943.1 argininosuccinate synthase [Bacteroidota bacterium]TAH61465.1 MAG: argininosuccinate synthase [Fermentimonas caenicola]MBP6196892.1 argininosuccinate synthase [Fermentimonas sp.]MBP7104188.1 argininosuccinate synthase [Fermentimonas sp.]